MLQRNSLSLLLAASLLCTSVATSPSAFAASSTNNSGGSRQTMTDTVIKKSRNSYSVPDVQRTVTTEDGEKVTLAKKNERLYRTAPLNHNAFTHEVRVSLQGLATVTGAPESSAHTLAVGYIMGCQIDASRPGKLEVSVPIQISPFIPVLGREGDYSTPDFKTTGKSFGLNLLRPKLWHGYAKNITLSKNVTFGVNIRPGHISKVSLASFSFHGNRTSWADLRDVHLFVDGCPGNVSLRSYVEYQDGVDNLGSDPTSTSKSKNGAKAQQPTPAGKPKKAPGAKRMSAGKKMLAKVLTPSRVNPDRTTEPSSGKKDGTSAQSAAKTPRDKSREKAEDASTQALASVGHPAGAKANQENKHQSSQQIEGLKFTIHGAVRWMSTLLPQTDLPTDNRNRHKEIHNKVWRPINKYIRRVIVTLTKPSASAGTPSPKGKSLS